MKLKDLTERHAVVVTTQSEYDKVKTIFDTDYKGVWIGGFKEETADPFVIGLFDDKFFTDGVFVKSDTSDDRGYTLIPAADFIASNTIP